MHISVPEIHSGKDYLIIMIILKKLVILIMIIILIVPGIPVKAAEGDQTLTIAFVPKSLDNPIFLDTFEAARRKAAELGVKLEWVAPFFTDTESQVRVINNLIKREVDGIIISVNGSDSLKKVIDKAVDSGIPVATFDSDSPASKRLFYIGTDNYQAGVAVGQALRNLLDGKKGDKKAYKTMILSGDRGALNLNKRIIGFKHALHGNYLLDIEILYCEDNIQLAIELVEEYLRDHPDLDIIFFTGGWPFYTPADAMPNFQEWSKRGGIAVGIDIFYSALLLQEQGMINYLVGQNFKEMGEKSLDYLVQYIREGTLPPVLINTGLTYADKTNIDRLLDIYKPWEVR